MLLKFDDDDDSYSSYSGSGGGTETFYFWFEGDKMCIDDRLYGNPEWTLTKK